MKKGFKGTKTNSLALLRRLANSTTISPERRAEAQRQLAIALQQQQQQQ